MDDHLGAALGGRAVPADLRRLVELELSGVLGGPDSVRPFRDVHVLGPDDPRGWWADPGRQQEHDPDTAANFRAIDDVMAHLAVVVEGPDGNLFGYWLHPDEPPTDQPTIVMFTTEGEFDTVDGATLVDALVYRHLDDDDDLDRAARFCSRHGLPLTASREALRTATTTVDPALLHDRQYRRYQPYSPRPDWAATAAATTTAATAGAGGTALVGLPVSDPRLREFLALLGFPDPEDAIARLDEGLGEVRLQSPVVPVTVRLYLDADDGWWLYLARYNRPSGQRPQQVPVPYGFSFAEDREATRVRFGPPAGTAMVVPVDRWLFGGVTAYVMFSDDTGPPRYIEFWPDGVRRR